MYLGLELEQESADALLKLPHQILVWLAEETDLGRGPRRRRRKRGAGVYQNVHGLPVLVHDKMVAVPLVAAVGIPILSRHQSIHGNPGVRSQVLSDVLVQPVNVGVEQNEGRSHGSRGHNHQLARIGGDGFSVSRVGDSGCGAVATDFNFHHGGVIRHDGAVLNSLRNLSHRRAHQRIVFAGHAGVQPMPAKDAMISIRGRFENRNSHGSGRLLVDHTGLIPVLAVVAVNVKDFFGF